MVGTDALRTHKRVVVWFPIPVENTERYFQRLRRLDQALDNGYWRMYERKLKPNTAHLVLNIDSPFFAALKKMGGGPYSGMGQAIFSLLGAKPEG
jgi:hypothetical protein